MKTVRTKRRYRKLDEVREQGLDAARLLLLKGGPSAVTLANVGRAIGMGHPNVLHHFGSATNLQHDLMQQMVKDLSTALSQAATEPLSDKTLSQSMIAKTYSAFGKEGGGLLAAWLVLSQSTDHFKKIGGAVDELRETLVTVQSPKAIEEHLSSIVLIVAICAFGDALIGKYLKGPLNLPPDASEKFLAQLVSALFANDDYGAP